MSLLKTSLSITLFFSMCPVGLFAELQQNRNFRKPKLWNEPMTLPVVYLTAYLQDLADTAEDFHPTFADSLAAMTHSPYFHFT